jgi:hypothetical protein
MMRGGGKRSCARDSCGGASCGGRDVDLFGKVTCGAEFVHIADATRVPVPEDGDCLFHALCHCTGSQFGDAQALRTKLSDWMASNAEHEICGSTVGQWVQWERPGAEFGVYCKEMATMGASNWGGGVEIAACSHACGINVHVYEPDGARFKRVACFDFGSNDAVTVHIVHTDKVHYDALLLTDPGVCAAPEAKAVAEAAASDGESCGDSDDESCGDSDDESCGDSDDESCGDGGDEACSDIAAAAIVGGGGDGGGHSLKSALQAQAGAAADLTDVRSTAAARPDAARQNTAVPDGPVVRPLA